MAETLLRRLDHRHTCIADKEAPDALIPMADGRSEMFPSSCIEAPHWKRGCGPCRIPPVAG